LGPTMTLICAAFGPLPMNDSPMNMSNFQKTI
jgi:hypothetical protein